VAERLSPTNLGMLLNSRQAALELGYINLEEFLNLTEKTYSTILRLPRFHGHFVNWYETTTLKPIEPLFISSVDNGNFIASLWSLKEGARELLRRPVMGPQILAGLADYFALIGDEKTQYRSITEALEANLNFDSSASPAAAELIQRLETLRSFARDYAPWLLPENKEILAVGGFKFPAADFTPANAEPYYTQFEAILSGLALQSNVSVSALQSELAACKQRLQDLAARLRKLITDCEKLSDEMDFGMLADKGRNLLSIGYDAAAEKLNKSCYDLLASEARTATFISVAKNDVIQDAWFRLGRQHTACEGETTLMSWTGTMFEYLMPVIWMKSHPNTLLNRTRRKPRRLAVLQLPGLND
jgi:hypothetical protein